MKKRMGAALMVLLMLAMPLTAMAETMYINTPNGGGVNLRNGPSTDDEILTSIAYGEPVNVIETLMGSSWVNIEYDGYYGYVSMRYLSNYPPTPGPLPTFVPRPIPTVMPLPTVRPTQKPSGGSSLEKTLADMYKNFRAVDYEAVVVPSTPSTYVNLRWAPSKSAPVRAQYWANTTLYVFNDNGTWSEVYDAATNTNGYIMSMFLRPAVVGAGADS